MISVRNLRVKYGATEILHGVSFEVSRAQKAAVRGILRTKLVPEYRA